MNCENIPEEMKNKKRWVLWKMETKKDSNGNEKKTKVPYQVSGYKANTKNSMTWNIFSTTYKTFESTEGYNGYGFVLGDGYCGIDIDHCVENEVIDNFAKTIIDRIKGYTEFSPSGTGIHIIVKGMKNGKECKYIYDEKNDKKIEMYGEGRYFTVTGNVLNNHNKIENIQEDIDYIDNIISQGQQDTKIIKLILKNEKYKRLIEGDNSEYANDESSGDAAIIWYMKNSLHCDFSTVERIMKKSKRNREKFDRSDYLKRTYDNCTPISFSEISIINLPQISIPIGRLDSEFTSDIANILKDKNLIFFRPNSREIVEIRKRKDNEKYIFTGFSILKPNRFITLIEQFVIPGIYNKKGFTKRSIGVDLSNTILQSHIIEGNLPILERIFTIPIPIFHNDELTFPKPGYDERFCSWLPYDAPKITEPEMTLEEAKNIIHEIFKEFCFESDQDKINAIAALLTPFLRGLFSSFSIRTPVFFYIANRERAGKDYLAGITGIIFEGYAQEEPPISTSENAKSNNTEELRKKILSLLIAGRKRAHFANCKGYINNATFESIITAQKYSDRILGKSDILSFDNELDFSLSGNCGVGWTADLENRCRFINLFLDIENANERKFERPNLHDWVLENREKILSALFCIIRNWVENGKPDGTEVFASFPEWARICGGVLESAGYGSPCTIVKSKLRLIGGDEETENMKSLFVLCYELFPDVEISQKEIREAIRMDNDDEIEIFENLDFNLRRDQTRFGLIIKKYTGRILGDITLSCNNPLDRSSRHRFKFSKNKKDSNDDSEKINENIFDE